MTRRMQHTDDPAWTPLLWVAGGGAAIIAAGIALQIAQLVVSIRTRDNRRVGADPWDGRTLEWSTTSPPPEYNFAIMPNVEGLDAYRGMKDAADKVPKKPDYVAIHMPQNTPTGFVTAFFAVITGFALIWHIWWAVILGLVGALVTFLVFAWRPRDEYEIDAAELARLEKGTAS
jgi:cytochrome o ubiquinol oxidase subunit 1